MSVLEVKDKKIELNEEGFLLHPEEWDEEVAKFLAKQEEGIDDLSEEHWKIIKYIRDYYLEKTTGAHG
jgi:tRNA 2-thiouridine synthesizing protein E